MKPKLDIQRICVRAVPQKQNKKYYEWETASICMFVRESDRDVALSKARGELQKRHWTFVRFEDKSTLIESEVRKAGGEVLLAYEEALRGRLFFKVFSDSFGSGEKDRKMMLPARISESFMDEVIIAAGGERVETSGIAEGVRSADYLLGKYIFELKDLQEEGMSKGPHQKRLVNLFRRYSDGENFVSIDPSKLSKADFLEYLNILGRPIQKHVVSASQQIKATRALLKRDELLGGIIVLNTGFGTFPHERFAEQVERYAKKDTSEFSAVVSISAWSATNGFDTNVFYRISPYEPQEPEVVAIRRSFEERYMRMMTQMVQGCLPTDAENAPIVGAVAFSNDDIDFAWEAPRMLLPWESVKGQRTKI